MEVLGVLLIPLVLAYMVAPIAAFFMAHGNRKMLAELNLRLNGLSQRLLDIERGRGPTSAGAPQAAPSEPSSQAAEPAPSIAGAPSEPAPPSPPPPPQAETPATPRPPVIPSPPTAPAESLEQIVGTRWVVWVGGLALALGGVFLVTYAIEQGYVGPGVRIALASLLAAALIAAGEWTRRNEQLTGFAGVPSAHVPSILTAAGTTIAYATVYGAFALYGFIGPAAAFVLLGIVAIATLMAALLHGPALAALGLVGAEVAPLLVSTEEPQFWALYIYLVVVTAAALALARARLWRWLAITAVVAGALWALPEIDNRAANVIGPHAFHIVAGFALIAALIVADFLFGPPAARGAIDEVSSGSLALYLIVAALFVVAVSHDSVALIVFALLAAATLGVAWRAEAATGAVPVGAILAGLVMFAFAAQRQVAQLIAPGGATAGLPPEPAVIDVTSHVVLGAGLAVLFGGAGFLAQGRSSRAIAPMCWAAAAVIAPLAILAALYYRIANFERSIPFAALAILLAALFAAATEMLDRRTPRPGSASAQAIFATGAIAALALAFTMGLEKGWLTIALALMVPGVAWVERQRRLHALRWLAGLLVVLVMLRIGWEPRIVGREIGVTPIFNWLLYGYGIPALGFWVAGYWLRRRADDVPTRMVESAAILFTVLLATLEIRHYVHRGNIYYPGSAFTEIALQVCTGLALAIGLEHLRARTRSIVHDVGGILIAGLTLIAIILGPLSAQNPRLTGIPVGGPFINLILLGYGIPAVLAVILALRARTTRPLGYRVIAAGTAVVLSLAYFSFEVMRLYHGPVLSAGDTTDAELYTYSAVWLAYGVALLVVGLVIDSKPARLASGAVILLTVLKVFFIDMADLTGVWRALSFIGLGIVLIGIGYLYQRLLFPPRPAPAVGAAPAV
jgi:uncharacterized membrane protein